MAQRPNILYLHSHDTSRYIQPYGFAVSTPNLQALAEQGILFRKAFTMNPTCSASRAAMLTGQSPHSSGMIGLAHRGFSLKDYSQHLVHTLRTAGYRSTLIGVQHVAKDPAIIGYDEVAAPKTGGSEHVASAAVEWLKAKPQEPFFLSVGFGHTHRAYPAPGPGDDPRYTAPPLPLPDTPEVRRDMASYHSSVRMLDWVMGRVLGGLEAAGLADNTLVVCTTDHGIAFPYMKCNLTDHGCGVMLMMRGPGGFTGGKVVDGLVSQVDLFPTLCDVLDIERPGWLQGTSFMPLVRGEAEEVNEAVFMEVTYHAAYEPMRAVRTQRYKYIRRFGGRGKPVLPNCDDSPSKTLWVDHGWAERPLADEELYDLIFDPHEAHNLAGDRSVAGVLDQMRARLDKWMKQTDDPLLAGEPVPAPSGAVYNDPDDYSPQGRHIKAP